MLGIYTHFGLSFNYSYNKLYNLIFHKFYQRQGQFRSSFDLHSALMTIEQWGFFNVPQLLRHAAPVYNGHLQGHMTLTPVGERLAWKWYYLFLAHLSWKLKWAFLVTCFRRQSSVCLWTFHIFIFSRTTGPISTKLGTKHPLVMGIQICSNEGPCHFLRGDNNEIAKIHWWTFKILFSIITGQISTKLGTKHTWIKGIEDSSNEGPRLFPRGDNKDIAKIHEL